MGTMSAAPMRGMCALLAAQVDPLAGHGDRAEQGRYELIPTADTV
jgi:hypothetical protein